MKIKKYYGNSCIGWCETCGKEFEDYRKRKQAYNHAKKTGHKVQIELSVVFHYNF